MEACVSNDLKGNLIGFITIHNESLHSIKNVLLVQGLMHKILSFAKLSDNGYDIIFNQKSFKVVSKKYGSVLFTGKRKNNTYKIRLSDLKTQNVKCLMFVNK